MHRSEVSTVLERDTAKNRIASILHALLVRIEEFPREGRTLLYGYDCDRNTCHVYLPDGWDEIVSVRYDASGTILDTFRFIFADPEKSSIVSASNLIPNKRLYPEACDFDLCCLLAEYGYRLPFTAYTERASDGKFWGLTAPAPASEAEA